MARGTLYNALYRLTEPSHTGDLPYLMQHHIPSPSHMLYLRFTIDQRGTFWWHAHVGNVRTSLHGPLIVHSRVPDPFVYDEERTILLNDWWHTVRTVITLCLIPNILAGFNRSDNGITL